MEKSIFGYGVYSSSKPPHQWRSEEELLLNNYLPARTTWEVRKKSRDVKWPSDKELQMEKDILTDEALNKLLSMDWTQEFFETLRGQRAEVSKYCIPIICDRNGAKDSGKIVESKGVHLELCLNHVRSIFISPG